MGFTGSVAGCVGGGVARGVALFPTKNWEQKSEGDLIWSKKETLTTQKGDPIFVFFRTVRKGGLQHKKETQRAPKSTKKVPWGRHPGSLKGTHLGTVVL